MRDGAVPDGWSLAHLGDHLARVVGGGTPSRNRPDYWAGDIPWASVKDMAKPRLETTKECISDAGLASSATNLIPPGTIVLATRMAVGAVAWTVRPTAINQDLKALFPRATLSADYLFYLMQMHGPRLALLSPGTTVSGLRLEALRALPVLLPPLPQQRKIADILSSVDGAIETTAAVIEQVRRAKQALARQLLTRGLAGRHTRFKQTEVGEIPEEWEVVRLGTVAEVVSGFALGPSRRPGTNARPYLTVANVQTAKVLLSATRYMEVSPEEYETRKLAAGDILMVEGHAQLSELGRAAIVPPEFEGFTFQNHLFRVRPEDGRCDAAFLCAYVNGQHGRAYFRSFGGTTSGLNTVSTMNIQGMPLPLPSINEQRRIGEALAAMEERIESESIRLERLHEAKSALMHVLLTGRVRVPTADSGMAGDKRDHVAV